MIINKKYNIKVHLNALRCGVVSKLELMFVMLNLKYYGSLNPGKEMMVPTLFTDTRYPYSIIHPSQENRPAHTDYNIPVHLIMTCFLEHGWFA